MAQEISLKDIEDNISEIFEEVKKVIPMGKGHINRMEDVTDESREALGELLKQFKGLLVILKALV